MIVILNQMKYIIGYYNNELEQWTLVHKIKAKH